MKSDSRQLSLFPRRPTLPSRPFPRWSRKLDEVRICARCQHQIVTRQTVRAARCSATVTVAGEC